MVAPPPKITLYPLPVVLKFVVVVTDPVKVMFPVVSVKVMVGAVVAPLTVTPPLWVTTKLPTSNEAILVTAEPESILRE
jgi:hypothetical protein